MHSDLLKSCHICLKKVHEDSYWSRSREESAELLKGTGRRFACHLRGFFSSDWLGRSWDIYAKFMMNSWFTFLRLRFYAMKAFIIFTYTGDYLYKTQPVKSGWHLFVNQRCSFSKNRSVMILLCNICFYPSRSHMIWSYSRPLVSYEHQLMHFLFFTVVFWHLIWGRDPGCRWNHLPWRSSQLCSF